MKAVPTGSRRRHAPGSGRARSMSTPSLEQQIANALRSHDIKSFELAAHIIDVVAAATAAAAAAEQARERAPDPTVIHPATLNAMQDAAYLSEHLQAALPPLREWLGAVQVAENASRCQAKRNALAREYAELYPQVAAQLCDLFRRAEAIDSE